MVFRQLLREAIDNSGLTLREVALLCEEQGAPIDHSYLSKIRSGALPPPSDKVARVLARVLGLDPMEVALKAYIDRAPEDLRQRLAAAC